LASLSTQSLSCFLLVSIIALFVLVSGRMIEIVNQVYNIPFSLLFICECAATTNYPHLSPTIIAI